jgi:MFS family permease
MMLRALGSKLSEEIGVETLFATARDAKILYAQRFVRLFAYGGTTLILAIYLADLGFSDSQNGLFMTLTLVGDVAVGLFLTIYTDTIGRRLTLALGSVLMIAGGIVFALSDVYWQLLVASIFGVVSPRYGAHVSRLPFVDD